MFLLCFIKATEFEKPLDRLYSLHSCRFQNNQQLVKYRFNFFA